VDDIHRDSQSTLITSEEHKSRI